MEQENQPEKIQFVIVPEFILTDANIPIGEKLLFGDIASHTKQKGYCWGSNEYFEKRYKVSTRTISRWINDLRKRNLIITNMIYQKGSVQITERQIMVNTDIPIIKEYMSWYGQQCHQSQDNNGLSPVVTDVQENNKDVNNKYLNLKETSGNITNVFMTNDEIKILKEEFGQALFDSALLEYSGWKVEKNAHPKSDFESLKKWLNKKRQKGAYKTNTTAVKETGVDEVSQETLANLPF
jgi:hypothetical protein